jgi:hypothetical protein
LGSLEASRCGCVNAERVLNKRKGITLVTGTALYNISDNLLCANGSDYFAVARTMQSLGVGRRSSDSRSSFLSRRPKCGTKKGKIDTPSIQRITVPIRGTWLPIMT